MGLEVEEGCILDRNGGREEGRGRRLETRHLVAMGGTAHIYDGDRSRMVTA